MSSHVDAVAASRFQHDKPTFMERRQGPGPAQKLGTAGDV